MSQLYPAHIATLRERTEKALEECGYDALLIHSGTPITYFADDQEAPFHSTPHFAHWTPLEGPHHLLLIRSGKLPLVVRVKPADYWYEQLPIGNPFWLTSIDFCEVGSLDAAWKEVSRGLSKSGVAFVGDAVECAKVKGIASKDINPAPLVARLNWNRSFKTPYEVECLAEAQKSAAVGHKAAKEAFLSGMSELEIHQCYLCSVSCVDHELPYGSIVALDEKGATLHYQNKRREIKGQTLLLDSGTKYLGYCSDITRTWARPGCDHVFKELVAGVDKLQQELCALVKPGLPYPELHETAHIKVGDLLHSLGILSIPGEEATGLGLTTAFFPHGLGHMLGTQVHDVAGNVSREGEPIASIKAFPNLRMTRTIEKDQVFTIEPGIYFIEALLKKEREGTHKDIFNWKLIDQLLPLGGVRIEDDVVVTEGGHRNLTREHI